MAAIRIVINGCQGRMGRALLDCASRNPGVQVTGQADIGDDLVPLLANADAVIDFTLAGATESVARACARHERALVIGTTGHTAAEAAAICDIINGIPVVWASNFSTGVNALFWLTRKAARIMGPEYDLEVVEMHHRMKKDAPSGTAASLARILAAERDLQLDQALRHGRAGMVGERTNKEIGMHSLRGGDVVGDHTVIFAAQGERLELMHKASSRDTFAMGALRAAQWVAGQKPGLYNMENVLGLE